MTDETPINPDQLDMSMDAKANVNWVNPDSLSRDELIRVNGINTALGWLQRQPFTDLTFSEVLGLAERACIYIKEGSIE
jgi:hypothetical protein